MACCLNVPYLCCVSVVFSHDEADEIDDRAMTNPPLGLQAGHYSGNSTLAQKGPRFNLSVVMNEIQPGSGSVNMELIKL